MTLPAFFFLYWLYAISPLLCQGRIPDIFCSQTSSKWTVTKAYLCPSYFSTNLWYRPFSSINSACHDTAILNHQDLPAVWCSDDGRSPTVSLLRYRLLNVTSNGYSLFLTAWQSHSTFSHRLLLTPILEAPSRWSSVKNCLKLFYLLFLSLSKRSYQISLIADKYAILLPLAS